MSSEPRRPLRVLIVEDNDADAQLVLRHLENAGYDVQWTRAEDEAQFMAALSPDLDVILADFNLPSFGAGPALALLSEHQPGVPLIVVSGSIGEETAVQVLQSGAADYLLKDRLARLGRAVGRVIEEGRLAAAKRVAEETLKETEERTRFALEAAGVGLWEADLRTGSARWSHILEALHGIPIGSFGGSFEAFLGRIHPDDREEATRAITEATRRHTESRILYRTEWPDGTTHWISAIGKTVYDELGVPLRAAGIGLDVTEQRTLEEQYRQSQKFEAIGQLAGGIAHDFNNLLTAILGFSHLLSRTLGPDSPHQEDLGEIRRAAERATSLTQQLLAFGRRQILEPRVLDLRLSLRSMESMLKRLIGENIEVALHATDEVACVKADAGQLEQVILNLAINARDAMPDGGSLLLEVMNVELDDEYARLHVSVAPGPYVMLSVTDTGTGMDAATQARIFEPFFTTKPSGKGSGLGLATVYGIVKQSRGYVWVYSEPGRGSTFKVYLPRVYEDASQSTAFEPETVTGSETILVVEDESAVRELARRVLVSCGYQVLVAANPDEALEIALTHDDRIDLLVSDVILPGKNGPALAAEIGVIRSNLRVLYMSGYTDNAVLQRGLLERDTRFLQKPFTPEVLARKVRAALDDQSGMEK